MFCLTTEGFCFLAQSLLSQMLLQLVCLSLPNGLGLLGDLWDELVGLLLAGARNSCSKRCLLGTKRIVESVVHYLFIFNKFN